MRTMRQAILIVVAMCGSACSNSTAQPPMAPPPTTCTLSTTMTFLPISGPSPSEGMPFAQYFAATIVPTQGAVYFVDVTTQPTGCFMTWTVVASDVNLVNISPASGNGRGRVELFMPPNTSAARQSTVTIAGQLATILQSGR